MIHTDTNTENDTVQLFIPIPIPIPMLESVPVWDRYALWYTWYWYHADSETNIINARLRHAKSWEPGNLIPRHLWNKIRTFLRYQRFEDYLSK